MGNSVDIVKNSNYGYQIASIEVQILDLKDFIEIEIQEGNSERLQELLGLAALQLEIALIELAFDIDPDSALRLAQNLLNLAKDEVIILSNNDKITQEEYEFLIEELNSCYNKISIILLNFEISPEEDDFENNENGNDEIVL